MDKAKVSFVKFENNDVIATSGIDYNNDLWVTGSMWNTYLSNDGNSGDVSGVYKGTEITKLSFVKYEGSSNYYKVWNGAPAVDYGKMTVYAGGFDSSGTPANVATSLQDVLDWIICNVQ